MKKLIASLFALTLMGTIAAYAQGVGAGVHVGGVGIGIHVGNGKPHRHCVSWGWRHHHREHFCRRWRR